MNAWETIREGNPNPLVDSLTTDTALLKYLQPTHIRSLLEVSTYLGLAPEKAQSFAQRIYTKFVDQETNDEP
jgi:hypothetical protein